MIAYCNRCYGTDFSHPVHSEDDPEMDDWCARCGSTTISITTERERHRRVLSDMADLLGRIETDDWDAETVDQAAPIYQRLESCLNGGDGGLI